MEAVKDANTVLGFRPGTSANEILLLDQGGNIAIFGNVETEGQLKSFAKEGVAPIYVVEDSGKTTPVDKYDATGKSEFGVCDMCGNVGEWVSDWFDKMYYPNSPEIDPKGPDTGYQRVFRGKAYLYDKILYNPYPMEGDSKHILKQY